MLRRIFKFFFMEGGIILIYTLAIFLPFFYLPVLKYNYYIIYIIWLFGILVGYTLMKNTIFLFVLNDLLGSLRRVGLIYIEKIKNEMEKEELKKTLKEELENMEKTIKEGNADNILKYYILKGVIKPLFFSVGYLGLIICIIFFVSYLVGYLLHKIIGSGLLTITQQLISSFTLALVIGNLLGIGIAVVYLLGKSFYNFDSLRKELLKPINDLRKEILKK